MDTRIRQIVLDFDAAVLRAVARGRDEATMRKHADRACARLVRLKKAATKDEQFEAIFSAAFEIKTKLDMAIETIRRIDAERNRP